MQRQVDKKEVWSRMWPFFGTSAYRIVVGWRHFKEGGWGGCAQEKRAQEMHVGKLDKTESIGTKTHT